jgi:NAD(P)-dependent dehydrogenase (short-subunit alcohol dehydrogenase family)
MAQRAAIVTGGSSGIGLGIARVLGEEGYGLTVAARRPEKLEEAVEGLRADGYDVNSVSGNLADEALVRRSFAPTASASGAWTCWSTTPVSGPARRSAS